MNSFPIGSAVIEKATGVRWWIVGVYHSQAPQGATLLLKRNIGTPGARGYSVDERLFKECEIEMEEER